ncbi:MAG: dTDP-4-dehydrorhamnose 3,5-epimerase [Elusimicrobia bacterium]|nr:dTDP-4-dehydrorhamnose 3,5-epimerase [Elusimicrobiota bacterium]
MPFKSTPYRLPGLLLIDGRSFPDERGFFMESSREDELRGLGLPPLLQDNLSRSRQGVLRGLHFQKPPRPQGKLVRCLRGRIFDVAVDLRRGSPSYGKWTSVELSDEGNRMFWIPAGFAHGFCALSEQADVMYKVTDYWAAEQDAGIRWDDPALGITWPEPRPLVSAKDRGLPLLREADPGFVYP